MGFNDWLGKDYHAILGVFKGVSDKDSKKAYHRLIRQYHPDQNPGNREAEKKFKTIGETYAVLSDPAQRKKYNALRAMTAGRPWFRTGASQHGTATDLEDAFLAMFTSGSGGGDSGSACYTARDPDLGDILSMFSNAADTAERSRNSGMRAGCPGFSTTFPNISTLSYCGSIVRLARGSGLGDGEGNGGSNRWFSFRAQNSAGISASTKLTFKQAHNGATVRSRLRGETITVRISPGVHDGQKVHLRGKDQPGLSDGEPENSVVTCCVEPHPYPHFDGKDLRFTLPVTFVEAVQGALIIMSLPGDSTVKVDVAAGAQSGRETRIPGYDLRVKSGRGDLCLQIRAAVPKDLSKVAKQATQAFTEAIRDANPCVQSDRLVAL